MALYAAVRYKRTWLVKLAIATLLLLGTFQLAEYMICAMGGGEGWAKIGLVAITLLPPLGLFLADAAAGKKPGNAAHDNLKIGLALSALAVIIPVSPVCRGNYAIFEYDWRFGAIYGTWYLFVIGLTAWRLYTTAKKAPKARRPVLSNLLIGYAAFLVPTAAVVLAAPQAYPGVPSIMCGFALIYAAILTFRVLPRAA